MKMPLIIIGTPSKSWFEPSLALAKSSNGADQDRFRHFFDDNFGSDTHEAPLMGTFSKHAQPQRISKRQMSWSSLSHPSENAVLTDLRAYWLRNALVDPSLNSRVLAFYSAPEDYLANLPGESDTLTALEVWKDAARCILDLIRSHRSRITLFAVEECLASAELFKNLLRQKYSIDAWKIPTQPEADAVRLALGKIQSQSDLEVVSLLAELDAASHPLAGDAPPRIPLQQALEAAWRHLDTGKLQPQAEYRKVLSSLQAIEIKHKESGEENELLLLQLHQVQEELESLHLKSKALEAEVEKANKSQAAAKKEYEEKIQDERKRKQDIEKQLSELKKSLSTAEVRANTLKTTEKKHKETEEENELLLLQLHQVQEELEHYFLENRRLQKERLGASGFGARLLNVGGLRMGHCHDTPPHRHLDFTLEQASLGERDLGSIRLRLVEHNGRPGLLVFQGHSPDSAPLHQWKSSGEEDGSPYMLVVPQDESGKDFLVAAPTSDLLFLRESAYFLAGELHAAVQNGGGQRKRDWARIAMRFIDLVDDIPQRLHYDDVSSRAGEDKSLHFTLRHAWIPASGLTRSLELTWKNLAIELLPPVDSEMPLTNWPLDEKTRAPISLTLDLSPRGNWRQQRKVWAGLTANDRSFLLLLVAELPNFAHHLATQNPELKIDQGALRNQAKAMLSRARGLASVRKPRRLFGIIPV